MSSHDDKKEPFKASVEQKAAAFEWLREHALTDELGAWYAGVLLREITELKSAQSAGKTREPDAYEFRGVLYRTINDEFKAQARPLYYDSFPSHEQRSYVIPLAEARKLRCPHCREGYPFTERSEKNGTLRFHQVGEYQLECAAHDLSALRCAPSATRRIDGVDWCVLRDGCYQPGRCLEEKRCCHVSPTDRGSEHG